VSSAVAHAVVVAIAVVASAASAVDMRR
jgi:hypothetical protein